MQQRSKEWHEFRRKHLGATDACVLMNGVHFGKTILDLYNEKTKPYEEIVQSESFAMRRGVELEPLALAKFEEETGYLMTPRVLTHWGHVWLSASLDGYEIEGQCAVEIKCPGKEDHALALKGIVPEKYVPQLQHQMYVTGLSEIYYMSYVSDSDFKIFKVKRDNDYIERLIDAETQFWQRVQNRNPPEPTDRDHIEIETKEWNSLSDQYAAIHVLKKDYQSKLDHIGEIEDKIKNELLAFSNNRPATGAGIRLSKVVRRGHIDYARIIEEYIGTHLDLEPFRKESTEYWKVNFQEEDQ